MEQEKQQDKQIDCPLTLPTLQRLNVNIEGDWRNQLRTLRQNVKESDFPPMKNSTILKVFTKEQKDHCPVWMMRQAGRFLPEFRETRKMGTFFDLCEHPILSCEVTLQPLHRMPSLDASIIFSDILVIPQAMGMEVVMEEKRGPVFPNPLREVSDLEKLQFPDVEATLGHVFDAIYLTRQSIQGNQTLYGFCGAPWTLFTYMTEGSGSKQFIEAKKWIYTRREESLKLLNMISDISIEYLSGQIKAGAQIVQIFDSWAGEIGGQAYIDFSFNFCKKIATELKKRHPQVPITLFPKGQSGNLAIHFKEDCFDCIGFDYAANLNHVKELKTKYNKVVQGNMDPGVLLGSQELIQEKINEMVDVLGTDNYIINLGHGLWPVHDPQNVKYFVETAQKITNEKIKSSQ